MGHDISCNDITTANCILKFSETQHSDDVTHYVVLSDKSLRFLRWTIYTCSVEYSWWSFNQNPPTTHFFLLWYLIYYLVLLRITIYSSAINRWKITLNSDRRIPQNSVRTQTKSKGATTLSSYKSSTHQ